MNVIEGVLQILITANVLFQLIGANNLNDVGVPVRFTHQQSENLICGAEVLRILRQLYLNVLGQDKDREQVLPLPLYLHPLGRTGIDQPQVLLPGNDVLVKVLHKSIRQHRRQGIVVILELLDNIIDGSQSKRV